ncbi:tetratricopeptide repeat protein [Clostridium sp. WILCCON 0269]|uniref:Tetratricopeptide repeat protein n=1 Tax=Candidatus Clostridium eludens TaxID=3381663 RepID=A0ABW8SKJ8_9CLOT
MNKSQKIYNKALNKYNNGYIDYAIKLCEESISLDIKNKASINLKGLLLYLKGDLDKAQKLWKMNYQINEDEVAQKYLESLKKDHEKIKFYKEALILTEQFKIDEALVLLEKCAESDFNYINVNNYSAVCYIKKGQYARALERIQNVLKVDIKNIEAKENMRLLENMNIIGKKSNIKKICYISLTGLLVVIFIFLVFNISHKGTVSIKSFFNAENIKTKGLNSQNTKKKAGNINEKINQNKENYEKLKETFPSADIQNYIKNKDYDSIYVQVIKWRNKKLEASEESLLSQASQLLNVEGCAYFYKLGCNYLNNKDYNDARTYLTKAYEFGMENELYPHIVYMLGASFDFSGDSKSTIKYYTEYDQKFSSGSYEETVLYRLALIYKDLDMTASKNYAKRLVETYPESIYNNSQINNLMN